MNDYNGFPWNNNQLVMDEYLKNNYYILDTKANSDKAIVFFSSNGIYYPNTEEAFLRAINGPRHGYEWTNIAKNKRIQSAFKKIMFVRDIYKQWYIMGINKDTDSVEGVVCLILEELRGYRITTCGSSAGGYMAALIGSLIGAERIVVNSAQFNLNLLKSTGPIVEHNKTVPDRLKYYDIHDYIDGEHIFYFCPAGYWEDIEQYNFVKDKLKYVFMIEGNQHGYTIDSCCYPKFLTMREERISELAIKYKGKIVGRKEVRREVLEPIENIKFVVGNWIKTKVKKMIRTPKR